MIDLIGNAILYGFLIECGVWGIAILLAIFDQ